MIRVLITGVTGFVGGHLAELCQSMPDLEVFGTVRWRSALSDISHLEGTRLIEVELTDASAVQAALQEVRPDRIFHFAGQSSVPASLEAPLHTLQANIAAQLNLFEGMRSAGLDSTRFLVPGSVEEYGPVRVEELPIDEDQPFRPISPYGVSKVAQDLLGWQYHYTYGLHVVRTRAFHQAGPRRPSNFVPSQFAKDLAEIEAGLRDPVLTVGNLDVVRDYTDIRDMVRAYWLALEMGEAGEVYNLGSGNGTRIRDMLDSLLGMTAIEVEVKVDPHLARASDAPVLICDPSRFFQATGWRPEIDLGETLHDTLNEWREAVKKRG